MEPLRQAEGRLHRQGQTNPITESIINGSDAIKRVGEKLGSYAEMMNKVTKRIGYTAKKYRAFLHKLNRRHGKHLPRPSLPRYVECMGYHVDRGNRREARLCKRRSIRVAMAYRFNRKHY